MVNRQEEKFLSEFRLPEVGEALVQLNIPAKGPNPMKFRAIVPGDVVGLGN